LTTPSLLSRATRQTLNLYAIVADNPETFADLDGHACDGPSGGSGGAPCDPKAAESGAPWEHKDAPNAAKEYHQERQNDPTHQGNDSKGGAQDKTTGQQVPGTTAQQPGGDNKKDDKSDLGLAGVAIITLEGSETGPFDIIVGGVALSVYLAQNSKHVKEVMDGLAAQIEKHLGKLGSTSNPDPKGGWKDEIRAARERMQRLSKRLGDKARQNYREIMDKAAKALEQDLE
jgi:hypothetical protein